MSTKLTLTIEQEIIEKAKAYAKSKNRSLSAIIESYLKMLTSASESSDQDLTREIQQLRGSFTAPENFDYKKELQNRREEKYL